MKKPILALLALVSLMGNLSAFELHLSSSQKSDINGVITSFAKDSSEELLKDASVLMPKVMTLLALPPLQTMAYISQDSYLKECMITSKQDFMKWNMFMQGFSGRMNQEKAFSDLEESIFDFAEYTSLDADLLFEMVDENAWSDFVCYVLGQ